MEPTTREPKEGPDASRRARLALWFHPLVGAGLVLLVLLGATAAVTRWRSAEDRAQERTELDTLTGETTARVTSSLMRYGDLLTSLAAFQRQTDRSLGAYQTYAGSIGVPDYPGITTTGYIDRVRSEAELADLVAERQRNGQPGFEPRLTGEGPEHAVVAYAVPDPTGITGIDLAGDPERWEALTRSAAGGLPVLSSSALTLDEWGLAPPEDDLTLEVFSPVYRSGAPITTVEERQEALIGWAGLVVNVPEVLASLSLGEGLLDVVLVDDGTAERLGESRPGAAERMDRMELTDSAVVDLGSDITFTMRTAFMPGARPHEGTSALAFSGAITALAAAYATLASLRFRRGLLARAEGERRRAELMASRFHAAVDGAPVGVIVVGTGGQVELVNDRLLELMLVDDPDGISIFDHFRPEDHAELAQSLQQLNTGEVEHLVRDRQLVRCDDTLLWCRITSSILRGPDGSPSGIVAHVEDIEAERAAVEELRSRTRWFSSIVERSSDLITLLDENGVVSWVSPSVGVLLGRQPDELLGESVASLIHRDDRARVIAAMQDVVAGRPARVEYRVVNGLGEWVWMESTGSSLLEDPDVRAVIVLSRDVTERHRTTELLAHRAAHDPLTGLANRTELERHLAAALERVSASDEALAVAYLDLDGFKAVNDSYGHPVGDELLRTMADALRQEVRDGDIIARVGGDEFVVVLPGADLARALTTADRIRVRLGEPVAIDGIEPLVQVAVSIGLAVAQPGDSVTSLLRDADAALYQAKRWGRDRIEVSRRPGTDADGEVAVEDLLDEAVRDAVADEGDRR